MVYYKINLYGECPYLTIDGANCYINGKLFSSFDNKNRSIILYRRGRLVTISIDFERMECIDSIKEQESVIDNLFKMFNLNKDSFSISTMYFGFYTEHKSITSLLSHSRLKRIPCSKNEVMFVGDGKCLSFTETEKSVLYRIKYRHRLKQKLNTNNILSSQLFLDDFIKTILNEMAKQYSLIKVLSPSSNRVIKTPDDAFMFICNMAFKEVGNDFIYSLINSLKQENIFQHRHYYCRLENKIQSILNWD